MITLTKPVKTNKTWWVNRNTLDFYYLTKKEASAVKTSLTPLFKAIYSVDDAEEIIKTFAKKTGILIRIKEVDPSYTFCSFTNFN